MLNEANLTNAILVRTVLTRSDLGDAIVDGADFSDAVIDLPQKQVNEKYTKLSSFEGTKQFCLLPGLVQICQGGKSSDWNGHQEKFGMF